MYSEHRVEQVCQTDTMRLRNKSKQMPVAVEAPRASVLNDLQARFVMAIKQLIGNTARWPLVGQHCTLTTVTTWSGRMPRTAAVGWRYSRRVVFFMDASSFYFTAKTSPARGHILATCRRITLPFPVRV